MKNNWATRWGWVAVWIAAAAGETPASQVFVRETPREFFGTGDFNGDQRQDIVIVDRASGKYRLGYTLPDGGIHWVKHRLAGFLDVSGLALGRLLDPAQDALVFVGINANLAHLVAANQPEVTPKPVPLSLTAVGPNSALAVTGGTAGAPQLHNLLVASIYNAPDANQIAQLVNRAGTFEAVAEGLETDAQFWQPNRAVLVHGDAELICGLWTTDTATTFRVQRWTRGKLENLLTLENLPAGSEYAIGHFRGKAQAELLLYQPGNPTLRLYPLEPGDAGGLRWGKPADFHLPKPIRSVLRVPREEGGSHLLIAFNQGETAEVFAFNGVQPPTSIGPVEPRSGDLIFGAAALETQFLVFFGPDYSKFSTDMQSYRCRARTVLPGDYRRLASMADNDDATVPLIHRQILEVLAQERIATAADMRPYTNAIPGTAVTYVMLPVPAGEFTLGSDPAEPGRLADEGPPVQLRIEPFWMGQCEVSWAEYEAYVWREDQRERRAQNPSPDYVNSVADAVTGPSKPYTDMSFGMGKQGYPAVSMTHHAANKYCHWLSAKTGHYYRLPTEAEWEYACRAGTTTAYHFGDDPSHLTDYAWFEENSDLRYHQLRRKRPNPWGFHDLYGNVWEWCLDRYAEDYRELGRQLHLAPWLRASAPFPHVARGGSYDDEATRLRSAGRKASHPAWQMRDPNLPKSIWWLTEAQSVGFRIVRPLAVPTPDQLVQAWSSDLEQSS